MISIDEEKTMNDNGYKQTHREAKKRKEKNSMRVQFSNLIENVCIIEIKPQNNRYFIVFIEL